MKKTKFFNTLAKKYNLPKEYIRFKLNPYYFYNSSVDLSENECEQFENAFNWNGIKDDYEMDRNREYSIFYNK